MLCQCPGRRHPLADERNQSQRLFGTPRFQSIQQVFGLGEGFGPLMRREMSGVNEVVVGVGQLDDFHAVIGGDQGVEVGRLPAILG